MKIRFKNIQLQSICWVLCSLLLQGCFQSTEPTPKGASPVGTENTPPAGASTTSIAPVSTTTAILASTTTVVSGSTTTVGGTNANIRAFDVDATYASSRYVSTTGNDSSNDGSRGRPYLTLGRALQGITPGTEVILLPGNYPPLGHHANIHGSLQQPIKIRGEGSVVINASTGNAGLALTDPRFLVLENFTVQNSPVHGMNIDDGGSFATPGEYLVLRGIHFLNIGSGGNNDCLKMSGITRFHVESSTFENCNMGEAIDMVGCHDGVITGNIFRNIPQHAVQTKGGSENVLIHANTFQNVAGHSINLGGSTGPIYMRPLGAVSEGIHIRASSNIFIDAGRAPAAFIACLGCEFVHNTIVNSGRWLLRILEGGSNSQQFPSRDGLVANNIFYFRLGNLSTFLNIGSGTLPMTFEFSNNLWFASDNNGFSGPDLSGVGGETNSLIQQNPNFLNQSGADFRLQPGSPAGAFGVTLQDPPVGDFNGRAYLSPPSLGAHQL